MSDNPARPPPGARLCALCEIPDPGAKGFYFRAGEKIFMGFVVRRFDLVQGYVDRCPHTGLPLAPLPDRYLTREGDLLICGSHGALFRIADGHCIGGPCVGRALWPWPIEVVDGQVLTA